jgi:hypothetical protein
MIYDNPAELRDRIAHLTHRPVRKDPLVIADTSDYVGLGEGMVLRIAGADYYIQGEAKEGRFGISEQPKFWVKRALHLGDGSAKIIKLVFHEEFTRSLGFVSVRCRRSPEKESAVLRLVEGDRRFMQGVTARDPSGNSVRIIDLIAGPSFFNHLADYDRLTHEAYYHQLLPGLLDKLVGSIEAMAFLHERGLEHGDIRNDHIIIERGTGAYRWIDFDYTVNYSDFDLWSMGNILTYAIGQGIITCRQAAAGGAPHQVGRASITADDSLLLYGYRLANLRAVYPHVAPALNDLLLRFSAGAREPFTDFGQMAGLLRAAIADAWPDRAAE